MPAKTSQVRSVWSQDAEASSELVGLNARPATGPSCPDSTCTGNAVRLDTLATWVQCSAAVGAICD